MSDDDGNEEFAAVLLEMARASGSDPVVGKFRRVLRAMTDRQLTELLRLRRADVDTIEQEARRRTEGSMSEMSEAKCQGTTKKGDPCSRSAGDSGYCLLHDPGEAAEPVAAAEPDDERHESEEYELVIRDLVWSVDHHQATVEFEALGAPNYSYSRNNPTLRVTVDMTMDLAHRLSSGVGSALVNRGGYREAAEVDPVTVATFGLPESKAQGAPTMPELQHIERACRRALRWHLKDARAELARAKGRADAVEALVGLSFPAARRS